ncbi:MAG: terminase [Minwuia sp.]|uniref:terminase n=1 Tax=Minwuia sp. TaxID=2493630 RepID=UPI003A85729F
MSATDPISDDTIDQRLSAFRDDPMGFVRWAFPWRVAGTPLHRAPGPERWQADILATIGRRLTEAALQGKGPDTEPVLVAVASGHGVGKSALVAWLVIWAMATARDTRGVVTANTEIQLKTKTWAELAKWFRLSRVRHRFRLGATALQARDSEAAKTWRIDMVPWSLTQTEAFAGLHNQGLRIVLVFDEASAIPAPVWEVAEGALTDRGTEIVWAVFGNPTQAAGRFRECFGRRRHRWITRHVDSRDTRLTNADQIARWIDDYGEDSDFIRVRVKGEFPRSSSRQFIGADLIDAARQRHPEPEADAPLVMGVDVARFGDDQSVILLRRGNLLAGEIQRFRGLDLMQLAARTAERITELHPDAVFVDGAGIGGGVIDRLRHLGHRVHDVNGGEAARRRRDYVNRRAEMWARMRHWLKDGAIPDDPALAADLAGPEYGFDAKGRIQLERKEDMKRRGLASPDAADALALTFADFAALSPDLKPQDAETGFRVL